ncbi:MAG: right-handed parallel beta-helix repeat-containing protein [Clostridia bacterium]|nr:right-handed parallel beta-helix repeat-containing protein [Clostridia bacterium]
MINVFDVTDFGAVGDGVTDCTESIQKALDAAGEVKGEVVIPPGKYLCGEVKVPESITVSGTHGWGYRDVGGSVLVLNNGDNTCLFNMTGAHGTKLSGLQFVGEEKGKNVHGIYVKWELYNGNGATFWDGYTTDFHEDSIVIDDCQVRFFSGNGIHLDHIFAFTIRNCHVIRNGGNGIYIDGWDGWISNTIVSFNDLYGIRGENVCSSITITGNRTEWNRMGGYCFDCGGSIIINSNSFDRNMGPAIYLPDTKKGKEHWRSKYVINGNVFWRNGKPRKTPFENELLSSHILIEKSANCIITSNTFEIGIDDGGGGIKSPDYGIALISSNGIIVKDNVMGNAAVKQRMYYESCDDCIEKDNIV